MERDETVLAEPWRYDPHERRMMQEALGIHPKQAAESGPQIDPSFEMLRRRREEIAAAVRNMADIQV